MSHQVCNSANARSRHHQSGREGKRSRDSRRSCRPTPDGSACFCRPDSAPDSACPPAPPTVGAGPARASGRRWTLEHFRFWCLLLKWTVVLSHPFRKMREKDGAPRILLTLNLKMLQADRKPGFHATRKMRCKCERFLATLCHKKGRLSSAKTTSRQRSYAKKRRPFHAFFLSTVTAINNALVRNAG